VLLLPLEILCQQGTGLHVTATDGRAGELIFNKALIENMNLYLISLFLQFSVWYESMSNTAGSNTCQLKSIFSLFYNH